MEGPTDSFKWFGEGFDGFLRGLPDDCVEYTVYIIDSKLQHGDIRRKLRGVQAAASTLIKELLKGFIWQRESFKLELAQEKGLSFLRGRTNYGDSVEDEWLIVYILRHLSRQHPDVWIRVVDTDGQFLLIEAANALPRWLNPDVAEYRVWINSGRLLIIPFEESPDQPGQNKLPTPAITMQEAHDFLEQNRSQLLHSLPVEKEAFYRLEKYPQQIKDSLHHALITIPRKLAYVLHEDETYISSAIEAFYLRDPIALRPLQATDDTTTLVFPPEDLVTVSVKFTKVGYAQLKSQQFSAPMVWDKALLDNRDAKTQVKAESGMKLTCGFEMLMLDPQNKDKRQVRETTLLLEDLSTGQNRLPSYAEIAQWRQTDDDERWLDINFEDFEEELAGNKGDSRMDAGNGFGDKAAQDNLRRMVAKFEGFLQDDKAGPEGAEHLDEMDDDDDDTKDDTSSQQEEIDFDGKDIEFDEEEFKWMMKGMMGISASKAQQPSKDVIQSHDVDLDSSLDTDGEEVNMRDAMRAMEHELRDAGALRLNPNPTRKDSTSQLEPVQEGFEDYEREDLDIDMNLAKNLLASFKGQAGDAGPGGNLMGLMGMRMPRDDDEESGDP